MGLARMLKMLYDARKPVSAGFREYYGAIGKASFSAETREGLASSVAKHTAPYKDVSTPGGAVDAFLFRGRKAAGGRGHTRELKRRLAEDDPVTTARRMFGTRYDDVIGEQTAAKEGIGQTRRAAGRSLNEAQEAELAAKTRYETQAGAWHPGKTPKSHVKKARQKRRNREQRQKTTAAKNDWMNARARTLGQDMRGTASVERATARFERTRAKTGATLTEAINDADASARGRPFAGIPNWIISHPKTILGAAVVPYALNAADTATGYAVGGPGYGGALGYGEGNLGGRNNVFQGANVNMNYQAQSMAYNELTSSAVLPQGSAGTAPMMSRKMGRQFQNSAQGLTLGLHKGRHGGY